MKEYEVFFFEDEVNKNYIFLNNVDDLYFVMEDIYDNL